MAAHTKWWHILQASKKEACLVVDVYNRSSGDRSLEAFVVHTHLAWLYLLHARFLRDGVDYRYQMDGHKPPDEDCHDARQRSDVEDQGCSVEELRRANELVPEASGVVPRSGTLVVVDRLVDRLSGDPVSLRILLGGGVVIGAILAARVKQVGSVEFFEGVPTKLPDVLRAGVELPSS